MLRSKFGAYEEMGQDTGVSAGSSGRMASYGRNYESAEAAANMYDSSSLRAENASLKERLNKMNMDLDLKLIRDYYPEEKAKAPMDLGDDFWRLRSCGIDPLLAYCAVKGRDEKRKAASPACLLYTSQVCVPGAGRR